MGSEELYLNNSICAVSAKARTISTEATSTNKQHYSCFTKQELISIINALNKYIIKKSLCKKELDICIEKSKGDKDLITLSNNDTLKELWYKIYDVLNPICKEEECWINLKYIDEISNKNLRDKLRYYTFKPKFYYRKGNWLTTLDINVLMRQVNYIYKDLYYLGAQPCDFYIIDKDVLNDKKMYNSKQVGIIFNLDTHNKSGSHWTSLFINNNDRTIYYFDSFGKNPNKYIIKFIKKYIENFRENYNLKQISLQDIFTIYINKKIHQKGNSECGIYAIYFLLKKLKYYNNPINDKVITDKQMKELRNYLFTKSTT